MANTIVLMASPRLESNTQILTTRIIDGLKAGGTSRNDIGKYHLVDYKKDVCTACGQCREAGECVQFPRVTALLDKIKKADNLVVATPTWWLSGSSYLKIFMDHWGAFLRPDYSSRIAGKKAIVAACCANPQVNFAEKVCTEISEILSILQVDVVGSIGVKGVKEIGEVSTQGAALEKAFDLGSKLSEA